MIFLIGKMFVYLLVALGLGAAAGWLWRHQQAAARETEMERQLMDSRSRLPQAETALRTREQQIEGLLAEVHVQEQAAAQQGALVAERDKALAALERTCAELRQRLESRQAAASKTPSGSHASRAGAEVDAAAGDELELHPGDPAAATDRVAPSEPVAEAAGPDPEAEAAAAERKRLTEHLDAARRELERARTALAAEQRRVAELSQERALQHRALAALEQQLEMARDDSRAANG